MWWGILWNWLTGNLGGIVQAIVGAVGKLDDNATVRYQAGALADKEVAISQLQTSAAVWHDRVDLLKGLKITSWLIAAALFPPIYHQTLVYLDSCPFFFIPYFGHAIGSWDVPPAPGVYAEREGQLILGLLGIQTTMSLGMGAIKALRWK